ncbi:MAG: GNAT family N-acetyltransferase [Rhodocyclaceae bacterium]|nr:GNAT family N-acetyltransferase [Rhodocyclaceae bacterium]
MNVITKMLISSADEAGFFGKLGRYFASPQIRRECGGYPLNDGADYRWLVAMNKRDLRVVAFLSIEHKTDMIVLRNGYVEPEWRGKGVFRELLRQALHYIDHHHLPALGNLPAASAAALKKLGFRAVSKRGAWVKIERIAR